MSSRWRAVLASVPMLIGLVIAAGAALPSVTPDDPSGLRGWPCGSVLFPNGAPTLQRVTEDGEPDGILDFCADALSTRRKITAAAVLGGALGSASILLLAGRTRHRQAKRSEALTSVP